MKDINKGFTIVKRLKEIMDNIKENIVHKFKGMHLTGPQGIITGILANEGEMKISDLSEKVGLSNSTVSGILDRLEKQKIIMRQRSGDDRRIVLVKVTSEFEKQAKEQFDEIDKFFEELILSNASSEELDTILQGLNTLKEVMERQDN